MSFVQARGATPSSVNSTTLQYSSNTTLGNLFFGALRCGTGSQLTTVTDDGGGSTNSWTLVGPYDQSPSGGRLYMFYRVNGSGGGPPTVSFGFDVLTSPQLIISEFSNVLTSAALDQTGTGAQATGTVATANSVTTTSSNEIILGALTFGANETFSQDGSNPWNLISGTGVPTPRLHIVYQEVNSTGTYSPAIDGNVSAVWLARAMSFIQSGPTSTFPLPRPWLNRPGRRSSLGR